MSRKPLGAASDDFGPPVPCLLTPSAHNQARSRPRQRNSYDFHRRDNSLMLFFVGLAPNGVRLEISGAQRHRACPAAAPENEIDTLSARMQALGGLHCGLSEPVQPKNASAFFKPLTRIWDIRRNTHGKSPVPRAMVELLSQVTLYILAASA